MVNINITPKEFVEARDLIYKGLDELDFLYCEHPEESLRYSDHDREELHRKTELIFNLLNSIELSLQLQS